MKSWGVMLALFLLLQAGSVPPSRAAEIYCRSVECEVITLEGQIEEGDYGKFVKSLQQSNGRVLIFSMTSPGGDLLEAMKIGRLVRKSLLHTITIGECNSACFFIYAAGVRRDTPATMAVGVHRPIFEPRYFKRLSHKEATAAYTELTELARAYLLEIGVSQSLVELTFNTPSHKVTLLDDQQQRMYGLVGDDPATTEWLRARCGGLSEQEEADLPCTNDSAAAELGCRELSAGYIAYLDKQITSIRSCEWHEQELVRRQVLKTLSGT